MGTLASVQKKIEKDHGKGTLFKVGSMEKVDVAWNPTGVLHLDLAMGGGFPGSTFSEIIGPNGLGKTTILYNTIGQAQARGEKCVLIDMEGSLNHQMARGSNINIKELHLVQTESGEEVLQICEDLMDADDVAVVGIDSIAGMTPAAVVAGDYEDSHVGVQARMLSQGLSKLRTALRMKLKNNQHPASFIFINQLRNKIGVSYGSPETTPGGEAMKYYAGMRLDVRKDSSSKVSDRYKISGTDEVWGHNLKVKVIENRFAPPLQVARFDMVYGRGITNSSSTVDLAETLGVVARNGAWYAHPATGEALGQGRAKTIERLDQDKEIRDVIEAEVRALYGLDTADFD